VIAPVESREGWRGTLFGAETATVVERLRRSVALVHTPHGHGSATIWESSGLLVTNDHVVDGGPIAVELSDGRRWPAGVVARDPRRDLAALSIPALDLPAAPVGDSRALRVGELILALGNPFDERGSAALGIVSATGCIGWAGTAPREVLLADVMLAPGSSGGPLADIAGRVVGIAAMVLHSGIAAAIPSHVVRHFLAEMRTESGTADARR
jgi:S1-C subfamily serine protease